MSSDTATRRLLEKAGPGHPVREFLRALGHRHTYRLVENPYAIFGFLWGIPIPFVCLGLQWWLAGHLVSLPLTLVFGAHPFLFAVVFGAMGTVRMKKDEHIERLVNALQEKVDALAVANAKLRELDKMKSEFVANVTHELKTPLVSVRGYTEMILEGRLGPANEGQLRGLRTSLRNIDRLQRMIDDLLLVGRLESNRLELRRVPFDLGSAVQAAFESFRPLLEDRRAELHVPAQPVVVDGDRDLIMRSIVNLISNAVKFTPQGGLVRVTVSRRDGTRGFARVEDNGCGVSEDQQIHLFERFWRAGTLPVGGTGLGLAITKGILDAHGAHVTFISDEGMGTIVDFDLPLVAEEGVRREASQEAHPCGR